MAEVERLIAALQGSGRRAWRIGRQATCDHVLPDDPEAIEASTHAGLAKAAHSAR